MGYHSFHLQSRFNAHLTPHCVESFSATETAPDQTTASSLTNATDPVNNEDLKQLVIGVLIALRGKPYCQNKQLSLQLSLYALLYQEPWYDLLLRLLVCVWWHC